MAEQKKTESPPDLSESLIFLVLVLLLGSALLVRIIFFVKAQAQIETSPISVILSFFTDWLVPRIKFFSLVISAASVVGIVWSLRCLTFLNRELNVFYGTVPSTELPLGLGQERNIKWERVLAHLASANQSDWRLAILEADIMLEELLETARFPGETLSDKLKNVEPSDFQSIEAAWEAHKVRNTIAHEGGDYVLTREEAERIVNLYRVVFEEFSYI
ncbi:hypothetical protein EPN83_02650 [Patescibacteria group bacterium]|nr:MAG: hypothetical protein EPN83_02650 [Patescibacteria group bacterium]